MLLHASKLIKEEGKLHEENKSTQMVGKIVQTLVKLVKVNPKLSEFLIPITKRDIDILQSLQLGKLI